MRKRGMRDVMTIVREEACFDRGGVAFTFNSGVTFFEELSGTLVSTLSELTDKQLTAMQRDVLES